MIELINFSKSYSSKKDSFAVQNFSMKCGQGMITGLLGPNGAGKTTILKAICARHFATSGQVLVEGLDASENPEKVRNLTGFVTETAEFPEEYTVAEFLKMTSDLHGANNQEGFSKLSERLSIPEISEKKIKKLSKGQSQRVNFSQALIYNPSVLVLDEPASGLDPAQIINMRNLVKSLKEKHTILLSTHLMQEVESLCDYVYIINRGKCVASGTIESILNQTSSKNLDEAFLFLTTGERNV